MIFQFTNSHPFEGSKIEVIDDEPQEGTCQILFGDGSSALGLCVKNDNGFILEVPGFTNTRGTRIVPREWSIVQDSQGNWRARTE